MNTLSRTRLQRRLGWIRTWMSPGPPCTVLGSPRHQEGQHVGSEEPPSSSSHSPWQPDAGATVPVGSRPTRGVRGVGRAVLPLNVQFQTRMPLAWQRVRGNRSCGISSYKRSHSEPRALLHNEGTRRYLMACKGLELRTKGHHSHCFVFGALRPGPGGGRSCKQATAYPTPPWLPRRPGGHVL